MGEKPGDIYETVYSNRLLRSDERHRVEGYIAHKWGLNTSLPLSHGFYADPPDIVVAAELVANFDGGDADTAYTSEDAGARVATFVGTAALDNAQRKFSGTSLFCDGNSDYVTFPQSTDFDLGANDFTVESWIRFNGDPTTTTQTWVAKWGSASLREFAFSLINNVLTMSYSTSGSNALTHEEPWNPDGDVWYHVASVREGDSWRLFVDGVQLGTDETLAVTLATVSTSLAVGANNNGTWVNFFDGWIDSVRIIKGTALYTNAFTPPTRSFVVPVAAALLANFNKTEDATSPPTVVEESVNAAVMTFSNGANIDTTQKKFGISSVEFPSATSFASLPNIADYDFGTGDFTIEAWVRTTASVASAQIVIDNRVGTPVPVIYVNNSGTLHYFMDSNRISSGAGAIAVDTWYHIAVCRNGGYTRMWLDGVLVVGTYTDANNYAPTNALRLGNDWNETGWWQGWIDGVRLIKGQGIYGGLGPTEPFDDTDTDTVLMNMIGADGATAYTTDDASARTCTFFGSAVLDGAQSVVGGTSLQYPDGYANGR
jgi:hypothetical protein